MRNKEKKEVLFMRNIKSFCPDIIKRIEVIDNWYGSYIDPLTGKLYVECTISTIQYNDNDIDVIISFWGNDDFFLGKRFTTDNMDKAIEKYKEFKKYVKKIPRGKKLQDILYKNNFVYDY